MIHSRRFACWLAALAACAYAPGSASAQTTQAQAINGLTQYPFGTPSGDETEILQLINRTRANPPAEGQRLVDSTNAAYPNHDSGIDLNALLAQFQSYPARPPLAFNALLQAAGEAHVADMIATGILQHNSSDGTNFARRIILFGYAHPVAENAAGTPGYPVSVLPWNAEVDYEIDWSTPGYGHRVNILEPGTLGEVEIGVAHHPLGGWNTQDFGEDNTPTLLTGAVFVDNAKTGFYASGEGVASVVVTAPGASSYYAVTTESGAYTLPLDLAPLYQPVAYLDSTDYPYPTYVQPPPRLGPPPTVQIVFTDALGNATTKTVTLGHTVLADGYTTYADADGNLRYDNAEVDLVEPATDQYPAFFDGRADLGGGVYYLAFPNGNTFGYYSFLVDPHYVYHFDLGYEYVFDAQDGQAGVYFYDFQSNGFFYTSPSFPFPYLYDFSLNSTVYYYPDPLNAGHYNTDGVRYFYVFSTEKIVTK